MQSFRSRKAASHLSTRSNLLVFIFKARYDPVAGMRGAQFTRHQRNGFTATHPVSHQLLNTFYRFLLLLVAQRR